MDESELGKEIPITPPDPTNREETESWLKQHITRPPAGYNDMKHPDGTPLDQDEQIDVFINQNLEVIDFQLKRKGGNDTIQSIQNNLMKIIEPSGKTKDA